MENMKQVVIDYLFNNYSNVERTEDPEKLKSFMSRAIRQVDTLPDNHLEFISKTLEGVHGIQVDLKETNTLADFLESLKTIKKESAILLETIPNIDIKKDTVLNHKYTTPLTFISGRDGFINMAIRKAKEILNQQEFTKFLTAAHNTIEEIDKVYVSKRQRMSGYKGN